MDEWVISKVLLQTTYKDSLRIYYENGLLQLPCLIVGILCILKHLGWLIILVYPYVSVLLWYHLLIQRFPVLTIQTDTNQVKWSLDRLLGSYKCSLQIRLGFVISSKPIANVPSFDLWHPPYLDFLLQSPEHKYCYNILLNLKTCNLITSQLLSSEAWELISQTQ